MTSVAQSDLLHDVMAHVLQVCVETACAVAYLCSKCMVIKMHDAVIDECKELQGDVC